LKPTAKVRPSLRDEDVSAFRVKVWVLHLFLKDHQPTGWLANIPASRQRRLSFHAIRRLQRGSIVADATVKTFHPHRWVETHG
jgi:hypothetical protein